MILPPCHSRRALPQESDVYFCAHPNYMIKDNLVTLENCRVCPWWQQPPPVEFRPFYLLPSGKPRRGLCEFLGEHIGLRHCGTCPGSVKVKVFACNHPAHVETTLNLCEACLDFQGRDNPEGKEDLSDQEGPS